MTMLARTPRVMAILALVIHHGVVAVHSAAHLALQIPLSPFQAAYVGIVILILPVLAVALVFLGRVRVGGVLLFASMIGALVFGVVSHAVVGGPDNMFEMSGGAWTTMFQVTSVVLAVVEGFSAWVGASIVRFAPQTS